MEPFVLDPGNTAWMLASASLVLLMTPALAFFYGGMTRSKSVLNMMMMSFGAIGVVGVVYVLCGYSMSFATPPGRRRRSGPGARPRSSGPSRCRSSGKRLRPARRATPWR